MDLENKFHSDPELAEHFKRQVLERGMRYHADFISPDTYERLLAAQGDLRGKKIADLGAGLVHLGVDHGSNYQLALENKGALLVPVDIDADKLITWNLIRGAKELDVAPVTADALRLPFADNSIDGVVTANVINLPPAKRQPDCHMRAYNLLHEAHRVLKKDGFFIVSSFGYFKKFHRDGQTTYNNDILESQIVTANEIQQIGQQLGFSEVAAVPLDETRLANSLQHITQQKPEYAERLEIVEPAAFLMKK